MNSLQQVLTSILTSPYAEKLGWCLLHSFWQIAAIGLVMKVCLDLTGQRNASNRYRIGMLALVLAITVPTFTWFLLPEPTTITARNSDAAVVETTSVLNVGPPFGETVEINATALSGQFELGKKRPEDISSDTLPLVSKKSNALATDKGKQPWVTWLAGAWLLGLLVCSIRPMMGLLGAKKLQRSATTAAPEWIQKSVRRLASKLGLHRIPAIKLSDFVDVPAVVGFIRPVILLPLSSLTNLSATEMDSILMHELAHIRRQDQLANIVQTVVETLLFYHPVVWWMSTQVRQERENCCDDIVVRQTGDSRSLIAALVAIEELRSGPVLKVGVLGSNGGSLVKRVRRLAQAPARASRSPSGMNSIIALLAAVGSIVLTWHTNGSGKGPEFSPHQSIASVTVTSQSDLYPWESHTTENERLTHRFWNIFDPAKRDQPGAKVDNWRPDLQFDFVVENHDEISPKKVTVEVALRDGFRWSVGNGVWDMESQWPMRYSLAELIRQSKYTDSKSDPEAELLRERLFNNTAWHREKANLAKNHHGKWVAIVDGRVMTSWEKFEDCVVAANAANPAATHRFIFRAGVDDVDQEFAYSPWITGQPNWWQLGIQFRQDHDITIGPDQWISNGRSLSNDANGRGTITLSSVSNPNRKTNRTAVCSGMFQQQATITEKDARDLQLHRFEVPGTVRSLTYQTDFQRVILQVSIAQLDIKQRVVAFVAPQSIVDMDKPVAAAPAAVFPVVQNPEKHAADSEEINTDLELLKMLQSATEKYIKLKKQATSVIVTGNSENSLTLYQVKVRTLDEHITRVSERIRSLILDISQVKSELAKEAFDLEALNLLLPSPIPNETAQNKEIAERIQNLEFQKAELESRLGHGHPDIQSLKRQIELWKQYHPDTDNETLAPRKIAGQQLKKMELELNTHKARLMALNEEFKFCYEKAKQHQILTEKLTRQQELIDTIKRRIQVRNENREYEQREKFLRNQLMQTILKNDPEYTDSLRLIESIREQLRHSQNWPNRRFDAELLEKVQEIKDDQQKDRDSTSDQQPEIDLPQLDGMVKIDVDEERGTIHLSGEEHDVEKVQRLIRKLETRKNELDSSDNSAEPPRPIKITPYDKKDPGESSGSVKIRVLPESGALLLTGKPEDVARVRRMVQSVLKQHEAQNGNDQSRKK